MTKTGGLPSTPGIRLSLSNKPVVAIVGRPNVGKSTLVNRIVGSREAIVEDRPGVTRDRKSFETTWQEREFSVVDTGGWLATSDPLAAKVTAQAEAAIRSADVVLFIVDSTTGITAEDERVAAMLRRVDLPTLVVSNKADNEARENDKWEFLQFGLGEPFSISALHGSRTGDLLDRMVLMLEESGAFERKQKPFVWTPNIRDTDNDDDELEEGETLGGLVGEDDDYDEEFFDEARDGTEFAEEDEEFAGLLHLEDAPNREKMNRKLGDDWIPSVAVVGRPNVGKSTLFNRLVGDERAVVHDMPGTTRDTIDTMVDTENGPIRFLDTAGMRRKSRIDDGIEYFSMVRALQAIERADAAVLVIDATDGISHQDQRLAERLDVSGTAVVILLNKWEMLDTDQRARAMVDIIDRLGFLAYAPVLRGSALTGKGVHRLLPAIDQALDAYQRRVPTRLLNQVVQAAQASHAPPNSRILYATQGAIDPPTFTIFASRELHPTYMRYIERKLREDLDLGPTPIKIRVRKRGS